MKFWSICYILIQVAYLEKIWFLRYIWFAKMLSTNQIAGFLNQNDKIVWFFAYLYKFMKVIKNYFKIFWWVWSKNECCSSGHGTLKLTVSQEEIDGINWLFACSYKFRKAVQLWLTLQLWLLNTEGQLQWKILNKWLEDWDVIC